MVGRQRAGDGADDEDRDADQHGDAPAVGIAELAVERRHGGGGQEIDRHDPGQVLEVAELAADGRQRRRDDGLVERRQEHGEHDAEDDRADLGMAQGGRRLLCSRLVGVTGPSYPSRSEAELI